MAGWIPSQLAERPSLLSSNVSRPLYGRTVTGHTNNQTHMMGMRGLRFMQQFCNTLHTIPVGAFNVPQAGPMTGTPRLRWVVSPLAQFVWWGAFVAADVEASGVSIKVHLETTAGVNIDGPIEWDLTNSRLPLRKYDTTPAGLLSSMDGREVFIHSGWREAGAGVAPRLLDLGANQGLDVVIRLETLGVRVLSHMALESYRAEQ